MKTQLIIICCHTVVAPVIYLRVTPTTSYYAAINVLESNISRIAMSVVCRIVSGVNINIKEYFGRRGSCGEVPSINSRPLYLREAKGAIMNVIRMTGMGLKREMGIAKVARGNHLNLIGVVGGSYRVGNTCHYSSKSGARRSLEVNFPLYGQVLTQDLIREYFTKFWEDNVAGKTSYFGVIMKVKTIEGRILSVSKLQVFNREVGVNRLVNILSGF